MTRIRFSPRLGATALAAALLGAATLPVVAQPAPAAAVQGQRADGPRHHRTPEQRQQAMARHAEAFKQKLQLTPDQAPAWTAFTQSMQPGQHARLGRQDMAQLTTPERIDHMRAVRTQRAAEADRRGEAAKTFYAALTPAQQKVFDAESARMFRHGPKGKHMHGHKGPRHGAAPAQ